MENQYELSVVIPNFNNANYLEQCILSVKNQTYPISQIIVVDDCSTDNSKSIINNLKIQCKNLKPIFLKTNGGVSNARNIGLSYVKTTYVTFIDADDFYINSKKIENEMNLIKKHPDMNVVAYSITVPCTNEGAPSYPSLHNKSFYLTGKIHFYLLEQLKWKSIMRDYCVATEIIRSVGGYDVERNLFEDWEVLLKISRKCYFFITMDYGTGYRASIDGLSNRTEKDYRTVVSDIINTELKHYNLFYKVWAKTCWIIITMAKTIWHWVRKCREVWLESA